MITSCITDMGSLTGMLYQGLVPVFADVEPDTLNMDPASVRAAITPKTGAIVVVHHAGLAADLDAFMEIARQTGLPVIEDCAQSYGCEYQGELVGRRGRLSTFSLNHFKHITSGSGGMVLTDDDDLRYLASLLVDKCYQREEGIRCNPFFLAPELSDDRDARGRGVGAIGTARRICGAALADGYAAVGAVGGSRRDLAAAHSSGREAFVFPISVQAF